jgi:flotillin
LLTLCIVYRQSKEAEASYLRKKGEADGLAEVAKAYGAMVEALGGPEYFIRYKMIETGTYEKLAKANGLAISGMQPKITMWNTGMSGVDPRCIYRYPCGTRSLTILSRNRKW